MLPELPMDRMLPELATDRMLAKLNILSRLKALK
jgi:hypothetical protein